MRRTEIGGPKSRPIQTECTGGILPDNGGDWIPRNKGHTASMRGE
jgi:hypothetical protein